MRYEGEVVTDKLIKLRSTRQDLEAELFALKHKRIKLLEVIQHLEDEEMALVGEVRERLMVGWPRLSYLVFSSCAHVPVVLDSTSDGNHFPTLAASLTGCPFPHTPLTCEPPLCHYCSLHQTPSSNHKVDGEAPLSCTPALNHVSNVCVPYRWTA